MQVNRLKNLIDKHSVISFDMFDTLINRDVVKPEDVFDIVECKYNDISFKCISGFRKLRLSAYETAYSKLKACCSINDIYHELELSELVKDRLLQLELETEKEVCVLNFEMKDIYDYAISSGKKVIITTDMYLPINVISEILSKSGINNYDGLFLSCEYGKSKTDGGLYDIVCKELSVSPNEVLHIGDGWKNDIVRATFKAIKTYHFSTRIRPSYHNSKGFSSVQKALYERQQKIISNHLIDCEDEAERVGFEVFGPLLYGFTQWLHESFHKAGIEKVYFLAREGLLFKNLFEFFYPDEKIEIHYLYVSRKSLVSPTYWIDSEYDSVMNSIAKSKQVSIESQVKRWGLDCKEFLDEIESVGFTPDTIIDGRLWKSNDKLKALFDLLKADIIQQSRDSYSILEKYLVQENFGGKCAIVDIGWNGGMQNAFQKIAKVWKNKTEIYGYYMGINSKNLGADLENAYGFLYDKNHGEENRYYIYSFAGPFELTMTAPHDTTVGYTEENGRVIPVFGTDEYIKPDGSFTAELEYTTQAQMGIEKYVRIAKRLSLMTDSEVAFRNCREFGLMPQSKHIELYRDFGANDLGEEQHFVSTKYHGIKGQHSIIQGFWKSTWKLGYMKSVFKLPLPYYKLYIHMRKRVD